jgi:hypothetical protein
LTVLARKNGSHEGTCVKTMKKVSLRDPFFRAKSMVLARKNGSLEDPFWEVPPPKTKSPFPTQIDFVFPDFPPKMTPWNSLCTGRILVSNMYCSTGTE